MVCSQELQGKWLLVEYYDGYVNGGHLQWSPVPQAYSHTLQFGSDELYIKTSLADGSSCNGSYELLPSSQLNIYTTCQLVGETMIVSYINNGVLIIDRNVREGKTRFKYMIVL